MARVLPGATYLKLTVVIDCARVSTTGQQPEVKESFPAIPWQQLARLRNRIVHGYWSIYLEILHTTATSW